MATQVLPLEKDYFHAFSAVKALIVQTIFYLHHSTMDVYRRDNDICDQHTCRDLFPGVTGQRSAACHNVGRRSKGGSLYDAGHDLIHCRRLTTVFGAM